MTKKIGIEQSLSDVEQALKQKGYDVVMMKTPEDAKNCDCCVVTGLDSNVQGIADTSTQAPVITASGMTADEICGRSGKKISLKKKKPKLRLRFFYSAEAAFLKRSSAIFISLRSTRSTRHCSIFSVLAMILITISDVLKS